MKADNLVSFLILGESFQTFTIEYNVGYGFAIYVLMKFPYIASFLTSFNLKIIFIDLFVCVSVFRHRVVSDSFRPHGL